MRKVFISYARANRPGVDELVGHLRDLGCDTWVDSALRGGQDWWQEILRRIADCDAFIAIISHDALKSVACSLEFDWAEALGKPILPVAMERPSVALPGRYSRRQIIDYSNPRERDRSAVRLGGALMSLPQAPPLPRPAPRPPLAPLSYLSGLIDMVSASRPLSREQQRQVLSRLEPAVRSLDPEEHQGGRAVLDKFGSRSDLYPDVDRSIADLKRGYDEAHRTATAVPARPPAVPAPARPQPRPPQPDPAAAPRFPGGRLGGPATLLGLAAIIGAIPPTVALTSDYDPDYPFAVWYLQTLSWVLVGIAFGVLGSRAAAVKGTWAVLSAWLMAPVVVLYAVNDLVWITLFLTKKSGGSYADLYELLSNVAYPALLGLMALVAVSFSLGVVGIKPVAWSVALTVWGLCGLLQAYLSRGAKVGETDPATADTVLIMLYLILLAVAVLMISGPVRTVPPVASSARRTR